MRGASGNSEFSNYHALRRRCKRGSVYAIIAASQLRLTLGTRPDLDEKDSLMKGTVFHGPHDVRVERVADPTIKTPTDALVRITRAGICGSDLHFYHGAFPIEPGFVLGHEGVGVIEEVGAGVERLKKGQRVVVSGVVACGRCFFCRRGQSSQCAEAGGAVFGYGANSAGKFGTLGGEQSEAVRVPMADYTCYP